MTSYTPPFTITSTILSQAGEISELVSDIKHIEAKQITPKLRKKNFVRSITGSLQDDNELRLEDGYFTFYQKLM